MQCKRACARSFARTSGEAHTRACTRVPAPHVSLECLGVQHAADERVRLEAMERLLLHPDPEGEGVGWTGREGGGINQAPLRDQEPNGEGGKILLTRRRNIFI
jgi:hypothetical protein